MSFIARNCEGVLPQGGRGEAADEALGTLVRDTVRNEIPGHFEALALSLGIEAWLRAVFACNQYIDAQAPWTLRKTDPERMQAVLATLYEAIADLAAVIAPIIPASSAKLLDAMGVPAGERDYAALGDDGRYARLAASGFTLAAPSGIFPRLDQPGEA